MKKPFVIGIGGNARVGKDTLADLLMQKLYNHDVTKYSLAFSLKNDLYDFVLNKTKKDIFMVEGKDKEDLRPLMVWWGTYMRQQSEGQYWINIIKERIKTCNPEIVIIPDIRHKEYNYDEMDFIKENGILIHLTRFHNNQEIPPANENEKKFSKILYDNADYRIVWGENYNTDELIKYALEFIKCKMN